MQLYTGQDHTVKEEEVVAKEPSLSALATTPAEYAVPAVGPFVPQPQPPNPSPSSYQKQQEQQQQQQLSPTEMIVDQTSGGAFSRGEQGDTDVAAAVGETEPINPFSPVAPLMPDREEDTGKHGVMDAPTGAEAVVGEQAVGAVVSPELPTSVDTVAPDREIGVYNFIACAETNGVAHVHKFGFLAPEPSSTDAVVTLPSTQGSMVSQQNGHRDAATAGGGSTIDIAMVGGETLPRQVSPASPTSWVEVGDETDPQALAETAVSVIHAAAESAAKGILYGTNASSPNGWVAMLQPSPAEVEGWGQSDPGQHQPQQAAQQVPQYVAAPAPGVVAASAAADRYPHLNGDRDGGLAYQSKDQSYHIHQTQQAYQQPEHMLHLQPQREHQHYPWAGTTTRVHHMHHHTFTHHHYLSPVMVAGIRNGSPLNVLAGGGSPTTPTNASRSPNRANITTTGTCASPHASSVINGSAAGTAEAIGSAVAAAALRAGAAADATGIPYMPYTLPQATPHLPQHTPQQQVAGYGYAPPGAQYAFYGPGGGLWHHHGAAVGAWGGGFGGQMTEMWGPLYGGAANGGGAGGNGYMGYGPKVPGAGSGQIGTCLERVQMVTNMKLSSAKRVERSNVFYKLASLTCLSTISGVPLPTIV